MTYHPSLSSLLQVLLDAGMTCMVSDLGMSVLLPSSGMKTESGECVVPTRFYFLL